MSRRAIQPFIIPFPCGGKDYTLILKGNSYQVEGGGLSNANLPPYASTPISQEMAIAALEAIKTRKLKESTWSARIGALSRLVEASMDVVDRTNIKKVIQRLNSLRYHPSSMPASHKAIFMKALNF